MNTLRSEKHSNSPLLCLDTYAYARGTRGTVLMYDLGGPEQEAGGSR